MNTQTNQTNLDSLINTVVESQKTVEKPSTNFYGIPMVPEQLAHMIAAEYRQIVLCSGSKPQNVDEVCYLITMVAKNLTNPHRRPGLMLCGSAGSGKSTLTRAIKAVIRKLAVSLAFPNRYRQSFSFQPELQVKEATKLATMLDDRREFEAIATAEMLCIDDLGVEPSKVSVYGTLFEPLPYIIEQRYNRRLFTLVTTNLTLTQIKEKYGERIMERLKEMMTIIPVTMPSYRQFDILS